MGLSVLFLRIRASDLPGPFAYRNLLGKVASAALDIDDASRAKVLQVLRSLEIPSHWIRMVEEYSELDSAEQTQMFGDSLPIGLRLVGATRVNNQAECSWLSSSQFSPSSLKRSRNVGTFSSGTTRAVGPSRL